MKIKCLPFSFLLLTLIATGYRAQAAEAALPRSTPEAQGVSSQIIRDYVESADKTIHAMHSFMLVRHGHVIAEGWWKPEAADKPHFAATAAPGNFAL